MTDQERALKLWVVLARAFNAVARHTDADIAGHGLTPGEFAILETLYHRGPLLLGDLQRRVLVSSGGVTYLVDRLEKQGLVERRACATDRRARYAALTAAGEARIGSIFPGHAAVVERAVAGLCAEEQALAIDLLRTLGLHAAREAPPAAARREDGLAELPGTNAEAART
jgi:MarR family 2-MHQ and catechol resistance regulon transcriptional repressor